MSEPMKKPLTNASKEKEGLISFQIGKRVRKFIGPASKVKTLLSVVKDMAFEEEGVPWREVVSEEIAEYGEGGLILRAARERTALTQTQLSDLTGIPQQNISEMEKGKRPIGKTVARKLAKVLDTDYRVFL